jgi:hypothetical protein
MAGDLTEGPPVEACDVFGGQLLSPIPRGAKIGNLGVWVH